MKDEELKEIKLNSQNIFKGKVIDVYLDDVKCPNGNNSKREYIKHPGGVCILAIDENNNVFMERQYRYAYDQVIYELPAGKLEKGEDPTLAAYREFEEETGYKALTMKDMGYMYPSCGYTSEIIHLYFTDKLIKTQTHLDDDEVIEIIKMPLNEVLEKIKNNEIVDAKTICLICRYLINK